MLDILPVPQRGAFSKEGGNVVVDADGSSFRSQAVSEVAATVSGKALSMGRFERYLTLWVALCIIVGIGLGQAAPAVFHALGTATVAQIN